MPDRTDQHLTLRDGRTLGYGEFGSDNGQVLFYLHGHPGSRMEALLGETAAREGGARVIALDRPGYGRSDFQPKRTLLDWPDDVVDAADQLGVDRFMVMGGSGGGPYALACAYKIPERLQAVAVVSGTGPFHAPGATEGMRWQNSIAFRLAGRVPAVANLAMWLMARQAQRNTERVVAQIKRAMGEADAAALDRPEVQSAFARVIEEAFRQGSRGAAWDMVLLGRQWGFRLEDVTAEVHLWQGERDLLVPPSMGRYMADKLPNCHATFVPNEGHLLVLSRMEEIQAALLAASSA